MSFTTKLNDFSITKKIPGVIVVATILVALATGYTAHDKFSIELEKFAKTQITAIRESRQATLELYLNSIQQDLELLAKKHLVQRAMVDFSAAWAGHGNTDETAGDLQNLYLQDNPNAIGKKDELIDAGDGSDYTIQHKKYHPWLNNFQKERGYHDIFLFSPAGDLVYSVFKKSDFATNFFTGEWRKTDLGIAFRTVNENQVPGVQVFFDFAPYAPSDGAVASFIATPLFDQSGAYIGVLAFQMPIGRLNSTMQVASGLGETGEAYIVGEDTLMRTDSRFSERSTTLEKVIESSSVTSALAGKTGTDVIDNDRGAPVISAYSPIDFMGTRWAILVEIGLAEVLAPITETRNFIVVSVLVITTLIALLALILARTMSRPIVEMTQTMRNLADGNLDIMVTNEQRADEIGGMAKALEVIKRNLIEGRQAELVTKQSEARLQKILESTPYGVSILTDDSGERVYTNPEFNEMFGGDRNISQTDKIIADSWVTAEDLETYQREAYDSGWDLDCEAHRKRADGTYWWCLMSTRPIDYEGRQAHMVWHFDITERKRAELKIAEKETQLRNALDNMTNGIYMLDAEQEYVLFNQRYLDLVDLPENLVEIGTPIAEVVRYHAERGDYGEGDPTTLVKDRLEQIRTITKDKRVLRAGPDRVLELIQTASEGGGSIVVLTDVTEQTKSNTALAKQIEISQSVLDNIDQGILMIDRSGNIVTANDRYSELLGMTADWRERNLTYDQMVKYYYEDVRNEENSDMFIERARESVRSEKEEVIERQIEDGKYLEIRQNPLESGGVVRTYADITNRKQAEAEIIQQKSVTDTVLNNVNQGLVLFDEHQQLLIWNSQYAKVINVDESELKPGINHLDLALVLAKRGNFGGGDDDVHDVASKRVEDLWSGALRSENSFGGGEIYDVQSTITPDNRLVIAYTDITEHKQAEDAATQSEARLRNILESSPFGVAIVDPASGERVYTNPEFNEMFGGDRNISQTDKKIADSWVAPEDLETYQREAIDSGWNFDCEAHRKRADGTYWWCLMSTRPIDYEGRQAPMVWHYDITARKQAEAEIVGKEEQLRMALDNIPGAIWAVDSDLNLVFASSHYTDIYGDAGGLVRPGAPISDIICQEAKLGFLGGDGDVEDIIAERLASYRDKGETTFEDLACDGRVMRLVRKTTDDGFVVTVAVDITELKNAETKLHEAIVVAEEATRAKSSFLATMSHEIRTPMNGLMSMAELLDQSELTEDQRSMSVIIRESGAALLVIINDILDFSKIEAGKLDLEYMDLSVIDVVEGVAQLLAPQASEKGLALTAFVDPDLPDFYQGDPVRLRQIMLNLAGNAVKFTEKGSVRIDVAAETGNDKNAVVVFRVKDTGIGLTQEQRDKLFQPFQQADSSTARKFGGTGLGLTICLRLVEMMGGEIGSDSVHGEGSTFWFMLPMPATAKQARDMNFDLSGARILTVGEDKDTRTLIQHYLVHQGAEIVHVVSDADALAQLMSAVKEGRPFDVVLVDHAQNGFEGTAFGQNILADPSLSKTKLVLITPYGSQASQEKVGDPCFFGYLSKPLRRDTLWRMVAAAIGLVSRENVVSRYNEQSSILVPPDVEEARTAGVLILVAEDNATNQVVIRKLLDKLGFAAEIADDGAIAYQKLLEADYGLLLTDCHMPEMDGYELTGKVRDWEKSEGRTRLPIVALTADALTGTEKLCLDAGMDGYLCKPVELAKLESTVIGLLPKIVELRRSETPKGETKTLPPDNEPNIEDGVDEDGLAILNLEMILMVFDEINEEVHEMLDEFVDLNRERIGQFQDDMENGDFAAARELAHAMKGSANTIGAYSFAKLSADIEESLNNDDHAHAKALEPELEPAFEKLVRKIAAL